MYVEDRQIRQRFIEENFGDNPPRVPVGVCDADTMLNYLRSR